MINNKISILKAHEQFKRDMKAKGRAWGIHEKFKHQKGLRNVEFRHLSEILAGNSYLRIKKSLTAISILAQLLSIFHKCET